MNSNYAVYLGSEAWESKRHQKLRQAQYKCEACGTKNRLQVHHLTYARIFQEEMDDLMVLCKLHHEAIEEMIQKGAVLRSGDVKALRTQTLVYCQPRSRPVISAPTDPDAPALMRSSRKVRKKKKMETVQSKAARCQSLRARMEADPAFTKATFLDRNNFKRWVHKYLGDSYSSMANALIAYKKMRKDRQRAHKNASRKFPASKS